MQFVNDSNGVDFIALFQTFNGVRARAYLRDAETLSKLSVAAGGSEKDFGIIAKAVRFQVTGRASAQNAWGEGKQCELEAGLRQQPYDHEGEGKPEENHEDATQQDRDEAQGPDETKDEVSGSVPPGAIPQGSSRLGSYRNPSGSFCTACVHARAQSTWGTGTCRSRAGDRTGDRRLLASCS